MYAQALIEKAALDGLFAELSLAASYVTQAFEEQPWLWLLLVVLLLLLIRQRRS
jgi:hypothetical protein